MRKYSLVALLSIAAITSCGGNSSPQSNPKVTGETKLIGTPITDQDIKAALNDPNYGPAIVILEDGTAVKNDAHLKMEKETAAEIKKLELENQNSDNLSSQAICDQMWGSNCRISHQWQYKGGIRKPERYYTSVLNSSNAVASRTISITVSNESSFTGGFDQAPIKAEIGYKSGYSLTDSLTISDIKPNSRVHVYVFQTGVGGNGTQYKYPLNFASCSQAGTECLRSSFNVFAAQSIGYRITN